VNLKLDPDFINLIKYIFQRQTSSFIIIFGRRGTGKTDLSLLIAEIQKVYGKIKHFATNIKVYDSHVPFEYITNLADLTDWCQTEKGVKLFILDEAGRAFKRRTPMSKINVEIIDKIQILRKYKLSLILVTPQEAYLDSASFGSDVLDGVFRKPNFKNRKIALYEDQLERFTLTLSEIPGTTVKFDTWDSATFTLGKQSRKPKFEDEDLNKIWKYANNECTIKDTGLHPQQFRRLLKKILKESLKEKITNHNSLS